MYLSVKRRYYAANVMILVCFLSVFCESNRDFVATLIFCELVHKIALKYRLNCLSTLNGEPAT